VIIVFLLLCAGFLYSVFFLLIPWVQYKRDIPKVIAIVNEYLTQKCNLHESRYNVYKSRLCYEESQKVIETDRKITEEFFECLKPFNVEAQFECTFCVTDTAHFEFINYVRKRELQEFQTINGKE